MISQREPAAQHVPSLDELQKEHQGHEKRLAELNGKAWLTPDEELEVRQLKKLKLRIKDRMELLRREAS